MIEPLGRGAETPEPTRCSWGWHKWTVWTTKNTTMAPRERPELRYVETRQERTCLSCGRLDRRVIE